MNLAKRPILAPRLDPLKRDNEEGQRLRGGAFTDGYVSVLSVSRFRNFSCDICRARKIRCDGPNMPDGCDCSNCLAFGSACTYLEPPRKRGPKNIMMEQLKKENASLKAKLRSLSICSLCAQPLESRPQGDVPSRSISVFQHPTPESDKSSDPKQTPEDHEGDQLATCFGQFYLEMMDTKHFGSASSFALVSNAITMKEQYLGQPSLAHSRRPKFWERLPWEKETLVPWPHYVFPDSDLIASLLDLYFVNIHPTMPLLHRPSFERLVAEGLHLTDVNFGGTLLSLLAVASRYSKDPRIFLDGDKAMSAGYKFFSQVRILRKLFKASIHEIQTYWLLTLYALGSSLPQAAWLYIGVGIRFIQQHGEHLRKREQKWDPEDELWRRAFWSFASLERVVCLFLGRPMGLHVEDYDVELPLEVDDEYWDQGFSQPPGKPSQLSYFVCHLRLCEILGDAMRRLYGSKKTKVMLGWDGLDWEHRAVAELDSAMNDFLDTIPLHLRWDPENLPQEIFFDQAAVLHITYNHILIVIHRLYIQRATTRGAPSLSICARAARAIIQTADIWLKRVQCVPMPVILNPVFVAGIILVLYIMQTARVGLPLDKNKDLIQVAKAMEILKFSESRLQPVGRLLDLLREIWALDYPRPKESPNDLLESVDADAAPQAVHFRSPDTSDPALSHVADEYYPQPGQSSDFWSSISPSGSPTLRPGMSIEELLSDTGPLQTHSMDISLDNELMSMWMAAPTDVANMGRWNTYLENMNMNGADMHWSNGFGAPQ
ncbi:fungal-specific transcription factor domain-containing protein [Mycena capillaripes]|nr:fungal-specific transcription factor domain-containing protein [Mycena capillaripes]